MPDQNPPFQIGDTLSLGPWPDGINNRAPDYAVPPTAIRNAVNVDVDNSGRMRTRAGLTKRFNAPGAHSLFSSTIGTFFVQAGQLFSLDTDNSATLIGNIGDSPLVHETFNDVVYWSNATSVGIIDNTQSLGTWGEVSPTLTDAQWEASNFDKYPEVYGPPLPCRIIRFFFGRLYLAVGEMLYYTEPYALHRIKYAKNFLPFPDTIQIIAPTIDGMWVCTEQETYWLQGTDPAEMTLTVQLNYGAVYGTAVDVPNSNDVMWRSVRGAILATEGGQIKNYMEDHAATNPAYQGAAIIREQNGLRQFLSTAVPTGTSPMIASSWMEAEIIRRSS